MRGKAILDYMGVPTKGITPAYAGKRGRSPSPSRPLRDHPRVCGEKEARMYPKNEVWGSPPRMRGKVFAFAHVNVYERITPAYAGKSGMPTPQQPLPGDHPRVCGEKAFWLCFLPLVSGSPPRMRGKGFVVDFGVFAVGITPAYAGKSACKSACDFSNGDHPRVCGEKHLRFRMLPRCVGSPPRMRGKAHFCKWFWLP